MILKQNAICLSQVATASLEKNNSPHGRQSIYSCLNRLVVQEKINILKEFYTEIKMQESIIHIIYFPWFEDCCHEYGDMASWFHVVD